MTTVKKFFSVVIAFAMLVGIFTMTGCENQKKTSEESKAQQLFLGKICTLDESQPYAEALTVADGKIQFVGSAQEAEKFCDGKTEIFDYSDKFIYPGFLEGHAHTMFAGNRSVGQANLTSVIPADAEKYKKIIKEFISKHPEKEVYIASGWVEDDNPDICSALLDEICPDKPLLLNTCGGHSILINKKAMEYFGVNADYVKKWGTELVRVDENGNPTGYICENPAIKIIASIPITVEEAKNYILDFQNFAFQNGYTGVCDAGTELMTPNALDAHVQLQKEGKLKLRTYAYMMVKDNVDDPVARIKEIAEYSKENSGEYFNVVGAKVFLDGVLEAHTSWLVDDYLDQPGYHGLERFNDKEKMVKLIAEAAKYNLAVHAHSEGDGATRFFLDCITEAQKISGNNDQRNVAAHLHFVRPEDVKKFADTNTVAVVPPLWAPKIPTTYEKESSFIGDEKYQTSYPIKSFVDAGVVTAFHTDYPVSPSFNAPMSIYSAVKRCVPQGFVEGMGGPDTENNIKEAITREQALLSLTKNVAYMWHQEDKLGSLEVGKIANMTILDTDLMNDDIEKVVRATVVATVVDGKEVYKAGTSDSQPFSYEDFINAWWYVEKYAWDDTTDWYEAMMNENWFD